MKCRHFFSFVLVLFLSLFFGSFIIINDSFALDDHVIILDDSSWSSLSNTYICGSDSGFTCSDYDYLIVESVDSSTATYNSHFQFRFLPSAQFVSYTPLVMSHLVITLTDSLNSINFANFSTLASPFSYRITLSDTLPSDCFPSPSGDISITSNGTYDVSSYATATVNVPAEVIQGDYHNDLISINNSILVCGAILLVLYFFYCIYRLIIKNSGVH